MGECFEIGPLVGRVLVWNRLKAERTILEGSFYIFIKVLLPVFSYTIDLPTSQDIRSNWNEMRMCVGLGFCTCGSSRMIALAHAPCDTAPFACDCQDSFLALHFGICHHGNQTQLVPGGPIEGSRKRLMAVWTAVSSAAACFVILGVKMLVRFPIALCFLWLLPFGLTMFTCQRQADWDHGQLYLHPEDLGSHQPRHTIKSEFRFRFRDQEGKTQYSTGKS